MKRRRRLVLQSLGAALTAVRGLAGAVPIKDHGSASAPRAETLHALVDTLIPGDATAPASAFGIDRAILDAARRDEQYSRLIEEGADWLDRSARMLGARDFASANEAQRIQVVQQAERAPVQAAPRRLFERVRVDAMRRYYAEPATWGTLGYTGPPQPAGFPDFQQPPATRR
jgi:hypothetical protein